MGMLLQRHYDKRAEASVASAHKPAEQLDSAGDLDEIKASFKELTERLHSTENELREARKGCEELAAQLVDARARAAAAEAAVAAKAEVAAEVAPEAEKPAKSQKK